MQSPWVRRLLSEFGHEGSRGAYEQRTLIGESRKKVRGLPTIREQSEADALRLFRGLRVEA